MFWSNQLAYELRRHRKECFPGEVVRERQYDSIVFIIEN